MRRRHGLGGGGQLLPEPVRQEPHRRPHALHRQPTAQGPPQIRSGDPAPQPLGGEPGEGTGLTHAEMQLALLVAEGEQHALGDSHFMPFGRLLQEPLGGFLGSRPLQTLRPALLTLRLLQTLRSLRFLLPVLLAISRARFGGWVGFVLPQFFVCG
ncbi:hypothetical protein STAN_4076 [Streptomyces sp. CBMAI 2042]|nr:hypothetical protein STAN_4076 [Streptomyces sp. CBMAI 2042]